jgi:hypothetical protein
MSELADDAMNSLLHDKGIRRKKLTDSVFAWFPQGD